MAITPEDYISYEVPSWVVDWANKTFTTSHNILRLANFYISNAVYRWISSIGTNTITLDQAPPLWAVVWVNYYKTT